MGLVLDWKKKLGYSVDPFEPVIRKPVARYLVGLTTLQEKFNLSLIKGERLATISGEHGTGKSTFLRWIDEELAPKRSHRQFYVDARLLSHADIVKMLSAGTTSFFTRTFNKQAGDQLLSRLAGQENVLLIDNAGGLSKETVALLRTIMDKTPTHVLLADSEEKLEKLELGAPQLRLRIPGYTAEQLVELLQRRIEGAGSSGLFPFAQEEVHALIKKADHNPLKLLSLARERAIELSLKVTSTPGPAAKPVETTGKKKLFAIKFDKGEKPQEVGLSGEEIPQEFEEVAPQETHSEDVQLLSQVVDRLEQRPVKPVHEEKTSHDRMIEKLAGEIVDKSPKARAPKKKVAAKKKQ